MVLVKFGMRSRPSMLVINDGCGYASSSRTDLLPFESSRGSKANVLSSMNKSAGRLTSTNSPGHTVVLADGARSTWARRIACRLRTVSVVPYVHVIIIIIIYTTYIAPYIWPVWPFIGAEEGPSKY